MSLLGSSRWIPFFRFLLIAAGAAVLPQPHPAAAAEAARLSLQAEAGGLVLRIEGPLARHQLQASTNLLQWQSVTQFTTLPQALPLPAGDPGTARFFRVEQLTDEPGERRFLLELAGHSPFSAGSKLADQTVLGANRIPFAVDAAAPDPAVALLAPGLLAADTANFIHQSSVLEADVNPTNGLYSGLRTRFTVMASENRLLKFDHRPGSAPVAAGGWTSLSTTSLCFSGYSSRRVAHDYADSRNSWMFFSGPGPSGSCFAFPDDTVHWALRLGQGTDEPPRQVPRPLVPIYSPAGAIDGFMVQNGAELQRVNANFGDPQTRYTAPGPFTVINGVPLIPTYANGALFGGSAPGVWLYIAPHLNSPGYLWAMPLAGTGAPTPLQPLTLDSSSTTGGLFSQRADTDGTSVYLASNTLRGAVILRVNDDLTFQVLTNTPLVIEELGLTESHVILRSGRTLHSLPKTGGPLRPLFTLPATEEFVPKFRLQRALHVLDGTSVRVRRFLGGGSNVWFETTSGRAPTRNHVHVIAADGSEAQPVRLASKSIVTWTAAPELRWSDPGLVHALYLADQWTLQSSSTSRADYGGQLLTAYSGVSRAALFEVGRFPDPTFQLGGTTFPALVFKQEVVGEPYQFGEPGLVPITGRTQNPAGDTAGGDLLFFRSDRPGLTPATHFGID